MKDSKLVILPSVVLNIILEAAKLMLKDNLVFTDSNFIFPIKNFEDSILKERIRTFGVYDIKDNKRVGVLWFKKHYCFTLQAPRKIFWRLKLTEYSQEEKGKKVVKILNDFHPEVKVQLTVKGNK